ncbi:hypothetical protein Tco_1128176, partial [Tanacetum coccineum]
MFNKAFKRVNTFVDYRTELVEESSKKAETKLEENLKKAKAEVMEGSSKRAGEELEKENAKKQKVNDDKDTAELQSLMEVIPDEEEVAVDVVPLATKPPTIGRQIRVQGNNARGAAAAGNGGAQYRAGNENAGQGKPIKCYNYNEIDLDEEQLLCLAAPTAQTMFMANLSSADPVYDEVGPSYDSDTLFE